LGAERDIAAALLAAPPRAVASVPGGGNNRLYRVEDAAGRAFALKTYLNSSTETRDRLGHEWSGLDFLCRHGVTCVPRPIALHRADGAALYGWVEGARVENVGAREIDAAVAFVASLKELSRQPDAIVLPLAVEACLSAEELIHQIERRLQRLAAVEDPRLRSVLQQEILPARDRAVTRVRAGYAAPQLAIARELTQEQRTLSPSDFGFHNALSTPGGLVFLDFEYFGWDDPVKLVADFLHHPGMALDDQAKRRFLAGARQVFAADPGFNLRLALLYPLYGLRWVCILLNEFLPERWARRAYAGAADRRAAEARQLAKARAKLADLGGLPHDA
jgi:hypothetical protein